MSTPPNVPLWQQLSGLTPDTEANFSPDERDAAISKLIVEVDRRARIEFDRAAADPQHSALSAPPVCAQRTLFWDPLDGICQDLGISRTKLSRYTRRLTGMRAQEIGDRLKAAKLRDQCRADLETELRPDMQKRIPYLIASRGLNDFFSAAAKTIDGRAHRKMLNDLQLELTEKYFRVRKQNRGQTRRAGFAARLGYANYSRLNRACLLAHGISLDQMEEDLIFNMVQKFLKEFRAAAAVIPPVVKGGVAGGAVPSPREGEGRRERGERGKPSTPQPNAADLELAREMMAEVLRLADEKEAADRQLAKA